MVRVDFEWCRVLGPGLLDGLEGCSPSQRLEVLGEVVGGHEGEDVGLEAFQLLVVEGLHGGVLDGPVHALGLAVGPGMVGFGEPVLDAVLPADAIEHMAAQAGGGPGAVLRQVGEVPLSVSTMRIWYGNAATTLRRKAGPVVV